MPYIPPKTKIFSASSISCFSEFNSKVNLQCRHYFHFTYANRFILIQGSLYLPAPGQGPAPWGNLEIFSSIFQEVPYSKNKMKPKGDCSLCLCRRRVYTNSRISRLFKQVNNTKSLNKNGALILKLILYSWGVMVD